MVNLRENGLTREMSFKDYGCYNYGIHEWFWGSQFSVVYRWDGNLRRSEIFQFQISMGHQFVVYKTIFISCQINECDHSFESSVRNNSTEFLTPWGRLSRNKEVTILNVPSSVYRALDKIYKINFNRHYLCYFLTKSYVLPLVRIVSTRRF